MKPNHRVKEPAIPCHPPVYFCMRAQGKPEKIDGNLQKDFWKPGTWINEFQDIEGPSRLKPWKWTKVKVLWDEEALYIGALLQDDTIWATVMSRDEVIFTDNDFEVFLAPQESSHRYYELEMNAANAVWDLYMEKPQRDGVHRIIGWDIHGLESAVKIDGRLNDPSAENRSWSLELKIPWFSLRECGEDQCYPSHFAPNPGETWRMNFSRVEYDVEIRDSHYRKVCDLESGKPMPEHNWVWAPTGVIDIHMPEMWGYLIFSDHGEVYPAPEENPAKLLLRRLYYREHAYSCREGKFTEDTLLLLGEGAGRCGLRVYTTPSMFEGIAEDQGQRWHIRQDGYLWME